MGVQRKLPNVPPIAATAKPQIADVTGRRRCFPESPTRDRDDNKCRDEHKNE